MKREPTILNWRWDTVSKQGHDFFMLKEILEQPQAMRRTLIQDRQTIVSITRDILSSRQVVLTACGTSRYAALIGRYILSKFGNKFSEVVMASEFHYFAESLDSSSLVIAVSQSGETADVIQGVKKAKENKATVFSLVNVVGSSLARISSDSVLYLNCGPEIGVAATKSFISQLTFFYLLGFAMLNRLHDGISKIKTISSLIEENLNDNMEKLKNFSMLYNKFFKLKCSIILKEDGEKENCFICKSEH